MTQLHLTEEQEDMVIELAQTWENIHAQYCTDIEELEAWARVEWSQPMLAEFANQLGSIPTKTDQRIVQGMALHCYMRAIGRC